MNDSTGSKIELIGLASANSGPNAIFTTLSGLDWIDELAHDFGSVKMTSAADLLHLGPKTHADEDCVQRDAHTHTRAHTHIADVMCSNNSVASLDTI